MGFTRSGFQNSGALYKILKLEVCKMAYEFILYSSSIAGMVLLLNGVVQLAVRNKTGPWKDGGASLLAGIIVVGVSLGVLMWLMGSILAFD
jgi:hypothetical protein